MKRRREHAANVADQVGAAPTGAWTSSPAAAHTLERARCHTRQTRCTPYARRVEIEWAPFIASTSGAKGPAASNWSTFA